MMSRWFLALLGLSLLVSVELLPSSLEGQIRGVTYAFWVHTKIKDGITMIIV